MAVSRCAQPADRADGKPPLIGKGVRYGLPRHGIAEDVDVDEGRCFIVNGGPRASRCGGRPLPDALASHTSGAWPPCGGDPRASQGFYAMTYLFSLFAVVAIQRNVRDVALIDERVGMPDLPSDSL